jgi:hypothetical protein
MPRSVRSLDLTVSSMRALPFSALTFEKARSMDSPIIQCHRRLAAFLLEVASSPQLPREPAAIEVVHDPAVAGLSAEVVAPVCVSAHHVTVLRVPSSARSARPVQFEVALNEAYPSQSSRGTILALASLATHVNVIAFYGEASHRLAFHSRVCLTRSGSGVIVSLDVPVEAAVGSDVSVAVMSVAGDPLPLSQSLAWPIRLRVYRGIAAPLVLETGVECTSHQSPAVSSDGVLYIPTFNGDVLAFSADGMRLPNVFRNEVKCNSIALCEAVMGEDILVLGLPDGGRSQLCAFSKRSMGPWVQKWASKTGDFDGYVFVGAIPRLGVVFATSCNARMVFAHSLSDGTRIASVPTHHNPVYISVDPLSNLIFTTTNRGLLCFKWDGANFVPHASLQASSALCAHTYHALAVVVRDTTSHLVAAAQSSSDLKVLTLPELRLVHTHSLVESVEGLAADPSGGALVVCCQNGRRVQTLQWPLPGMLL